MKKKQVKENDYMDMMIPGKVVGEVPGAKTLTLERRSLRSSIPILMMAVCITTNWRRN